MAALSSTMVYSLRRMLEPTITMAEACTAQETHASIMSDDNYIYNRFITCLKHSDKFTIPVMLIPKVMHYLHLRNDMGFIPFKDAESKNFTSILYANNSTVEVSTTPSILKKMGGEDFNYRFLWKLSIKDRIFYAGFGALFDVNMKPLFLTTIEASLQDFWNADCRSSFDEDGIYYSNAFKSCVYISPKVFQEKHFFYTAIKDKIIPFYSSTCTYIDRFESAIRSITAKCSVIVDNNIDNFVISKEASGRMREGYDARSSEAINAKAYRILNNKISDILATLNTVTG